MKSSESGEFYIKNSVICTADTIISRYRSFGFFDEKNYSYKNSYKNILGQKSVKL